jgi:hypothetical protein
MRSRWVIATTPANNATKLESISGCLRCVDARQLVTLSRSVEIIHQPSDKKRLETGNQPIPILPMIAEMIILLKPGQPFAAYSLQQIETHAYLYPFKGTRIRCK